MALHAERYGWLMTQPHSASRSATGPSASASAAGRPTSAAFISASFPRDGDEVIADWQPEPYHQAFKSVLNGGMIGTLLDCHSNWTAAIPPDAEARRRQAANDRHGRLSRPAAEADPGRRPSADAGTRRRVDRGPGDGRGDARVRRSRHGHLPGDVRRRHGPATRPTVAGEPRSSSSRSAALSSAGR